MKTIDEIREEYNIYEVEDKEYITNLINLRTYIYVGIDDLNETVLFLKKEMVENNKYKLGAVIRNLFPFVFEEEELVFYDADNELINEAIELASRQKKYFKSIISISNEDNYEELHKLTEFTIDYYNSHVEYIDVKRDILEMYMKGYKMTNSRGKDNRKVFDEFFLEKISELSTYNIENKRKIMVK